MNNGYTTIQIGGETIGLKFGLPSVRMMLQKVAEFPDIWGHVVGEDGNIYQSFNEAGYAYMLHSGYVNYCMVKEEKVTHRFEFFMDYIESVAYDTEKAKPLNEVIEIWARSREVMKVAEDNASKKKNGQPMKSNPSATAASGSQ